MKRFIKAYSTTGAKAQICVYLDDDDTNIRSYLDMLEPWYFGIVVRKRRSLGEIYLDHFTAFPNEPWYGYLADDLVPQTPSWDKILIETAGSDGIAYGNDLLQGERLCSHPVIGGDLVREMGWLSYPGLSRLFIDTVWHTIGKQRGVLRYRPDVILEHKHYINSGAEFDATYDVAPDVLAADRKLFDKFLYEQDQIV